MKRQNIRKALILISFFLFPITLSYFSPVLIIEGAARGIIVGSFLLFVSLFFLSLFFGRLWCGWICPGAGLQEACFSVTSKPAKGGKYDLIKFFIWVPWIISILVVSYNAGGFREVSPFHGIEHGISVLELRNYVIYYFFLGLIVVLAFTVGKRAFCHYVCWMSPFMIIGSKIKNLMGWPSLSLKVNSELCVNCNQCNKRCPMSLDVQQMVQRRNMNISECILCGECIDGCPKDVIGYSFWSKKH